MSAQHTPEREYMPILGTPFAVRMDVLSEEQAQRNHGQSLERLAQRGGLSFNEAAAVAKRERWEQRKTADALKVLQEEFESARAAIAKAAGAAT